MAETERPSEPSSQQPNEPPIEAPSEPAPVRTAGAARLFGDRSLSVVGVLVAGLVVLAALLAVILFTRRNEDTGPITLTCLPVSLAEAEASLAAGAIDRVTVLTEEGSPETGPLAVSLDLAEGCRALPEGVAAQDTLYRFIGAVTVFNQIAAGEQRIQLVWEQQGNIPPAILATATPPPTATAPPTATVPAAATALPTATASTTPTTVPTATSAPTIASPAAVPTTTPTAAPVSAIAPASPTAAPATTATPRPSPAATPAPSAAPIETTLAPRATERAPSTAPPRPPAPTSPSS